MSQRTTIDYRGNAYPFYRTNRGQFDFENAGFTNQDILAGKTSALLAAVFYNLRDCARRAGMPINDSFEEFIDNTEPDVIQVFVRLAKAQENTQEEGEQKAPAGT